MSLIKILQANPDKFQALAIGKNTFKEQICFDLKGCKIKCEEHVKLLGVTIDYELREWDAFIHCFKRATHIFYFYTLFSTRQIAA
jgi:hypothetical protein